MPGKIATSMKGDPPDGCGARGAPHRPSSMGDLIDALVENAATLVRQSTLVDASLVRGFSIVFGVVSVALLASAAASMKLPATARRG